MLLRKLPLWAALAAFGPILPAHAQIDQFIQGLIRPPPPAYPYYNPPPAYPPPGYAPYYRDYPPAYYVPGRPRGPARPDTTVADAQRMLGELGYDAGPVDGAAGPRLADALRGFQRDHGQRADGRLTGETLAALRAVSRERGAQGGGKPAPANAQAEAAPPPPAAAAASAGLPTEGRYCRFGPGNSFDELLVRDEGGSLQFGMSSWTPEGDNFSVSGRASRDGASFRYEDGMRSPNESERCKVTIRRTADGGYQVATAPDGRCETNGGMRAVPIPGQPTIFSAASRVGNPPRSFTPEQVVNAGCERPRRGTSRAADPSPGLLFEAPATAESATRTVQFRLTCMPGGKSGASNLTLAVVVPDTDRLRSTIDLDAIEGPPPHKEARVKLEAAHADADAPVAATFLANASRIDDAAIEIDVGGAGAKSSSASLLQGVLGTLAEGPGRLAWRLENPASGGPALEATLRVSQADSAALSQSLRSCLIAR